MNGGEVFLESKRYENKEMVHQTVSKVCYTNVNGLMSTKMELNELLNRTTPDVAVFCETKWKNEFGTLDIGDDKYDLWLENRSDHSD